MSGLATDRVVAIIGAGTMGAGIAQVAAAAGHPVRLFDQQAEAVHEGIKRTGKGLDKLVERGKMSREDVDTLMARITPAERLDDLADAGLVIEAIVEDRDIKAGLFQTLEALCADDCILATNTSSISVTAISAGMARPERLVGMHFFNPAPIMKLVEVISGLATDPGIVELIYQTAMSWGKVAVHARSTPGFIVNRVARPFYAEGLRIVEEGGATAAEVDACLKSSTGFRMGPFELMDLIGNDVNYAVTRSVYDAYYQDTRFRPSLLQADMVAAGRLGRKSGQGYFNYSDGATEPPLKIVEPGLLPDRLRLMGRLGIAHALKRRSEAAGIKVEQCTGDGYLMIDGICIRPSDGRSATQMAAESRHDDTVIFDLAADYDHVSFLAIAVSDQAGDDALDVATGFFSALGIDCLLIDDIPGMICLRTVCMLANEAADAVGQQVASESDVDLAMQFGVNYPRGPIEWARQIGLSCVVEVLDNLSLHYQESRYRVSSWLRRQEYAQADDQQPEQYSH